MSFTCEPCTAARDLVRVSDNLRVIRRYAPSLERSADGDAVKSAARRWEAARNTPHTHGPR